MKTRIALVLETSGGGSGRHVLDLAAGLSRESFDVTVIYSPIRASKSFLTALFAIPGLHIEAVDMGRSVGLNDWQSLRKLKAVFRRLGPFDITHAHSSKAGALARLLPDRLTGKRFYTPHCFITMDPELGRASRFLYGSIERLLALRCDAVITVSERELEHAISLKIPRSRIEKVVNGSNLISQFGRGSARKKLGVSATDVVFGFVGRLDSQKNPGRFVNAINIAHARRPQIRGVVFGDGPLRGELEAQVDREACFFMGWCDAASYMLGFDAFVLTSRYEAMPYTLIEALHSGLPIIATDVGGVRETVRSRTNGAIVSSDAEPDEIADQMLCLATDREKIRRWGKASQRLSARLTVDQMIERTVQAYRQSLAHW